MASFELYPQEVHQRVWDSSGHGDFTIKSTLDLIKSDNHEEEDKVWSFMWKLMAPQRIKFFLWLVAHERVLTNAHRMQKGLTVDPSCKIYGHHEKDISHILRGCPIAKEVWTKLLLFNPISNFFSLPFRTWLSSNVEPSSMILGHWPLLFAGAVCWLWKWRNHKYFEDPSFKPYKPSEFIYAKFKEISGIERSWSSTQK